MTERWRKKLGDIDTQSPTDDVFERAKDGPTRGQDRFDDEPTSRRVFAGVAAIVVFALAIAIFVVPFLRMGDQPADSEVTATLFPVWPSQSSGDLQQLQAQADAGQADWAIDPASLAEKFGRDVMGWPDAHAVRTFEPYCFVPSQNGTSSSPIACNNLPVGGESVPGNMPPDLPRPSVAGMRTATKEFAVFPATGGPVAAAPEWVQLYQPLQQGDGAIWAVLQAQGEGSLSVAPGQVVHDGASVGATFYPSGGGVPSLGYRACGSSQAISEQPPSGDRPSTPQVDVQLQGVCTGAQPGYVWGVTASQPLSSDSGVIDPLNGGGVSLTSLSVVPVTMVFDGGAAQGSPSGSATPVLASNPSPSMPAVGWGTYSDAFGWTIDVPKSWTMNELTTQGAGTQGAAFVGDTMSVRVTTETAAKNAAPPGLSLPTKPDSSFPLDEGALLQSKGSGLEGQFRGDGLLFSVRVSSPASPGQLSATDQAILDRMIGSITFQPWHVGEVRHDWVAIPTPTEDISWINIEGGLYMLFRTADGYELYGSISCAGSDPTKTAATSDGFAKLTCPDGSTWEMDAGGASGGGGDAATNDPPPQWAVTTASDGTLIAWVLPGYFPEGTGGSPTP